MRQYNKIEWSVTASGVCVLGTSRPRPSAQTKVAMEKTVPLVLRFVRPQSTFDLERSVCYLGLNWIKPDVLARAGLWSISMSENVRTRKNTGGRNRRRMSRHTFGSEGKVRRK